MKTCLEIAANIASILTAVVAAIAYGHYRSDMRKKRTMLEDYLKKEKLDNPDRRTHSVLHLMAKLGLTESEILHASFTSHHIIRKEHINKDTSLTDQILFEYLINRSDC